MRDIVYGLRMQQTSRIANEAADEIERLREDKAELLKALTGLYEVCRWEKVAPEIDAAKAAIAKATGGELVEAASQMWSDNMHDKIHKTLGGE